MKIIRDSFVRRFLSEESGQALPWMALMGVLVLSFGGIAVDLGHMYVCKRYLQASTDSAAMAGAFAMAQSTATSTSVKNTATSYSVATGAYNANGVFSNVNITPTLKCLATVTSWGIPCTASTTGFNALQVTQSATVNTWFIRAVAMFGVSAAQNFTLTSVATVAMQGAANDQYNVAIVVDTTSSMGSNDTDANCNNTRIHCALSGVQTLLQSLSPCGPASSSNCVPFDQVALFTFPNVTAKTSSDGTSYSTQDTVCPTSNPTIPSYSTPGTSATWSAPTTGNPTYQITSFLSNYSSTNQSGGAISTSSSLGIATGAKSGCQGLQTPGGDGTYLAGAIYAAQSALVTAKSNNPGSKNAMIILSDGAANTTKMTNGKHNGNTYPSLDYQCTQSITAADAATSAGTKVITIAYGASTATSGQCTTDPSLSPCTELLQMASTSADFYSDATASQNKGQCTSASNPNLNLNQIFQHVAFGFTKARMIPDNTN